MKKNSIVFLLISILLVCFTSCLTIGKISIQVLEPAHYKISPTIVKISLADHSNLKKGRYFLHVKQGDEVKSKTKLDSVLSRALMFGLIDNLDNSPRFVFNNTYKYIKSKNFTNRFDLLNWDEVKKICDKDTSDALVSLEYFTVSDSLSKNIAYQPMNGGYYGSMVINTYSLWRIYYPYSGNKYTDLTIRDTIGWEEFNNSSADVALSLPERSYALEQACYKAGKRFGATISQQWKEVDRLVYVSGNDELREGKELIDQKKWKEAIEVWKKSLDEKKNNNDFKAALSFNLAVGNEVLDNIDTALEWAAKSYYYNPLPETQKYISQLEQRKKDNIKIQEDLK